MINITNLNQDSYQTSVEPTLEANQSTLTSNLKLTK